MGKKHIITINSDSIGDAINKLNDMAAKKPFIITNAKIKEGICEYGYEINDGPCTGDRISGRKGSNLVHDDMGNSFDELNVHLAILDDHFKNISITDFDSMKENSGLYRIIGFKITGSDDNEGFILIGEKYVSHGHVSFETPKITKGSSYSYWEELCKSMESARTEVELYMNGKMAPKYEQGTLDMPDQDNGEFNKPM